MSTRFSSDTIFTMGSIGGPIYEFKLARPVSGDEMRGTVTNDEGKIIGMAVAGGMLVPIVNEDGSLAVESVSDLAARMAIPPFGGRVLHDPTPSDDPLDAHPWEVGAFPTPDLFAHDKAAIANYHAGIITADEIRAYVNTLPFHDQVRFWNDALDIGHGDCAPSDSPQSAYTAYVSKAATVMNDEEMQGRCDWAMSRRDEADAIGKAQAVKREEEREDAKRRRQEDRLAEHIQDFIGAYFALASEGVSSDITDHLHYDDDANKLHAKTPWGEMVLQGAFGVRVSEDHQEQLRQRFHTWASEQTQQRIDTALEGMEIPKTSPSQLSSAVADVVERAQRRVGPDSIGAQQYWVEGEPQKFDKMPLLGLIDYALEETLDLVNYGVMTTIRLDRLRAVIALALGVEETA